MSSMKTVHPNNMPEQYELLHQKKSTMQVATCKHEGHEYFLNKLYSDTKKRIDDKYRQRKKWLTKEAAIACIEAE